jgi:hypothetical protein
MSDIETRLRDAFAAVDRAVVVPPEPSVAVPRHPARLLVAAAAIAAVVAVGAVLATRSGDNELSVATRPVDAITFNARVEPICVRALADRRGHQPRFATPEAYRTVADQRIGLIRRLRSDIDAQSPPADAPGLVRDVVVALDVAEARASDVLAMADRGDLDALAQAWPDVDDRLDDGLRLLRDHGAKECQP